MKWKSAKDSRSVLLQVKHQFEPNDGGPDLLAWEMNNELIPKLS